MKLTLLKESVFVAISKMRVNQTSKKWSARPNSIINFYSPLIIIFMKQLILLILVTGMVATSAFAANDALPGTIARPVTCKDDPLHPIAGRPYDYSAILNPTGGTTYWYATKSTIFVTAGVKNAVEIAADGTTIMSGATNYRTLGSGAASPNTTNVTWTSAGLKGVDATTNPLFMVLEYKGPTCSNNMKVYQILPMNAFTVDITNIKSNGLTSLAYGTTDTQCYADIVSAKYDATAKNMVYDYGVNKLYFEVIAANFTGSFTPSFKLTGLHKGQSALVEWTIDKTLAGGFAALGAAQNAVDVTTSLNYAGTAVTTLEPNTSQGVSIYVRVTVTNGLYEGLTDDKVTLAVEAVNANNEPDIDNTTCAVGVGYEDTADQTLNMRPTVTSVPATGAFVVQTLP